MKTIYWLVRRELWEHKVELIWAPIATAMTFVGFAMIVLPGPAFVVIPAGLAILGLEFAWARHTLRALRKRGAIIVAAAKSKLR